MKNRLNPFLMFVLVVSLLLGCTKEDDPSLAEITVAPFAKTIGENPSPGTSLGTLQATTSRGTMSYTLSEEVPAGALSINATTGELTVKDTAKFDFETNAIIKAKGTATVDGMGESASITITLTDAEEPDQKLANADTVSVEDFTVTIDENPTRGQALGTVQASASRGAVTFTLINQSPDSALTIDARNGKLSVADSARFDYEINPTLTATVTATVGTATDTATVTITLNDVEEAVLASITADDIDQTVDENPTNGQVLGTVAATSTGGDITYTLSSEDPKGGIAIDAGTGEITVADSSLFNYEDRQTLTYEVKLTNNDTTVTVQAVYRLNDVNDDLPAVFTAVELWGGYNNTFATSDPDYVLMDIADTEDYPVIYVKNYDKQSTYSLHLTAAFDDNVTTSLSLTEQKPNTFDSYSAPSQDDVILYIKDAGSIDLGSYQYTVEVREDRTNQRLTPKKRATDTRYREAVGIRLIDRDSPTFLTTPSYSDANRSGVDELTAGSTLTVDAWPKIPASDKDGVRVGLYQQGKLETRVGYFTTTGSNQEYGRFKFTIPTTLRSGEYEIRLERMNANGTSVEKASYFQEFTIR